MGDNPQNPPINSPLTQGHKPAGHEMQDKSWQRVLAGSRTIGSSRATQPLLISLPLRFTRLDIMSDDDWGGFILGG